MTKMQAITLEQLHELEKNYGEDIKARVVRNALTNNSLDTISRVFEATVDNPNFFSVEIKTKPVTNQQSSGRCWLFSSLNILREIVSNKYKIADQFEISQNYIAFYDKLEKINYFLESMIQEIDKEYDDETVRYLLSMAIGDGGQWDMMVSLVKKYGLCPKTAMPETYQSSHTNEMNHLLNARLRKFVADAKSCKRIEEIGELKNQCLKECYSLLCSCFGIPPKSFTFEFVDEDGKYQAYRNVTPLEFYHDFIGVNLDDYVGIINGPTADKPFYKMYTVKYLGNVIGTENPVAFLNLPMNEFKDAIIKQMKDGELVWFGCDCGKYGDRKVGLWDDQGYDYETTFDIQLSMTKAEMLDTRESAMNHAMVLTAVNLVDDKPTRWKIQNSWGDQIANKGFYICSDTWFDKYVFEAVVNKKYLTEEQRRYLSLKPIELKPWDPFGSLA